VSAQHAKANIELAEAFRQGLRKSAERKELQDKLSREAWGQ